MGACVSIHHKASAMKVQASFDSAIKPDHTSVIHPSPTTGELMDEEHVATEPQPLPSQSPVATFSEYGSREEAFFDSQAWLDSDYEDEFMSVNGEFTPSRGNTPVHHSLIHRTPPVNVGATLTNHNEPLGSTSEPSPTPTERRRLLDLFKESLRDNHGSSFERAVAEPSKKDEGHVDVSSKLGCFKSFISIRSTGKQKTPNS